MRVIIGNAMLIWIQFEKLWSQSFFSGLNYFPHRPAPKNEDEMMVAIFEYIDRLFNIVRPRRVLYMAIDGVVRHLK